MKTYIQIIGAMTIATSLICAEDAPKGPKRPGKGGRPMAEEIFKKLDADSSGSVSLDEFKAGPRAKENPEKAEEIFKKIDKDSSSDISLEEFKNVRPPGKEGKGKRGGKDAPPTE
jgi:EF hand